MKKFERKNEQIHDKNLNKTELCKLIKNINTANCKRGKYLVDPIEKRIVVCVNQLLYVAQIVIM